MNQPPQDSAGQSRLDILIADYMSQVDESVDVDVNEFLKPHPDLADEFRDYLRNSRLADAIAPGDSQSNPQASRDTTPSMAVDETIAPRDMLARPGSAGSVSKHPTRREYDASQTRQATSGSQGVFSLTLPEPTLPRPFGRYELIRLLGRGAMGSVYLAEDAELKRQVALKIPKFTSGTDHDKLLERFAREARSAAAIEHPNICPVYDIGEHDGQSFIAMMLVAGKTLGDLIRDSKRIDPRVAITLTRKIALALAEAHDRGIIHRDLKPSNIMINQRNEPIVMDFGLAREIDSEGQEQLTQDGTIVGTPTYMSPEQVDGIQGNVGTASDIYSLGVVFYELLTGRVPFTGRTLSVMAQIASKQPPPPTSIRADLSPHIEATCLKMMHKQATHRQETMHQVAEELAALLRGDVPTVVGNVAAPVTGAQLKAQSDQVHALIKASDWPEAERVLMQMESNESPVAANYAKWASEQLVTVRAALVQKRSEANLAYQQAESRMKHHDYIAAMEVLSSVPASVRTPGSQHLLQKAVGSQTQVDALFKQIQRNFQTGQLSETLPHLQKLLALKPNDQVAQYLFRKYQWRSRFGFPAGWLADAFAPAQTQVTRPTYEEPFLRKWIGIAGLVFVIFAIGTAAAVTIRIKQNGKQKVAIRVTDEALAEGDVEIEIDGTETTLFKTDERQDDEQALGTERQSSSSSTGMAIPSDEKKVSDTFSNPTRNVKQVPAVDSPEPDSAAVSVPSEPLPPFASEKEAATWVIEQGGRVEMEIDGQTRKFTAMPIPYNAKRLHIISFPTSNLKPAEIARFGSLPNLKMLILPHQQLLTKSHLKAMHSLSSLSWLGIVSLELGDVKDADVAELLEHLPNVGFFRCSGVALNGSCFNNADLPNLDQIDIGSANLHIVDEQRSRISKTAIKNLKRFPKLRRLTLRMGIVSREVLGALHELPTLEYLNLSHVQGIEGQCDTLGKFKSLTTLSLLNTSLSDSDIESLGAIKTLVKLDLRTHGPTNRSDESIKRLREALPDCEILTGVVSDN